MREWSTLNVTCEQGQHGASVSAARDSTRDSVRGAAHLMWVLGIVGAPECGVARLGPEDRLDREGAEERLALRVVEKCGGAGRDVLELAGSRLG